MSLAGTALVALVTTAALALAGEPVDRALKGTAPGFGLKVTRGSDDIDSWAVMVLAYERRVADPSSRLYAPFFDEGVKFQYPPSSLLVLDLLPATMTTTIPDASRSGLARRVSGRLGAFAGAASQAATLGLILLSALLFEMALRRNQPGDASRAVTASRVGVAVVLGCTFYPVVQGHSLGQVQVYLNGLAGVALLAFVLQRPAWAGSLIGLCCLVKPQFGVILVWAVLRRHWRLATALAVVVTLGLSVSLARYGWHDHLDYLHVLRTISEHGEVYWPNQSINGLAHRLLQNGDPTSFEARAYAPADPLVNAVTFLSSAAILVLACWPPRQRQPGPTFAHLDFMVIIVAATMASPVAWEHHYGVLLPVFALAVPLVMHIAPLGRWTGPVLLGSFAATANVVLRPQLLFANRWWGLLGSHLFLGAMTLFVVLLAARRDSSAVTPPDTSIA